MRAKDGALVSRAGAKDTLPLAESSARAAGTSGAGAAAAAAAAAAWLASCCSCCSTLAGGGPMRSTSTATAPAIQQPNKVRGCTSHAGDARPSKGAAKQMHAPAAPSVVPVTLIALRHSSVGRQRMQCHTQQTRAALHLVQLPPACMRPLPHLLAPPGGSCCPRCKAGPSGPPALRSSLQTSAASARPAGTPPCPPPPLPLRPALQSAGDNTNAHVRWAVCPLQRLLPTPPPFPTFSQRTATAWDR